MAIQIKNICKSYDNIVLDDFSLELDSNEFVVLLGPSGCGKTTLLRIIAGLTKQDKGEIYIENVNQDCVKCRDLSYVTQEYSLYPHLTVYENLAFPLKNKKINRKEIDKKINQIASDFDFSNLLTRKPRQLSGGQMQRVAVARALIKDSSLVLMDEPFSNLEHKLKLKLIALLKKKFKEVDKTFLYVTHDVSEAMFLATRLIVMNNGKILQSGSPNELFFSPNCKAVCEILYPGIKNYFIKKNNSYLPLNGEETEIYFIPPTMFKRSDDKTTLKLKAGPRFDFSSTIFYDEYFNEYVIDGIDYVLEKDYYFIIKNSGIVLTSGSE